MRTLHVALVENDVSLNRAYSRVLRAHGWTVDSYLSAEALLAAGPVAPDCLVLDIDLGGMSGLALHAYLRAAHNAVPVIFITGGENPGAEAQAWAGGCRGFLRKPFSAVQLQAAILGATAP
jgi:FixJ family two-component response regulator